MSDALEILETSEGGTLVLDVRGELDIATAPILDERLRALLAEHGQFELDLAQLAFIDSTGLAVLVSAAQAAAHNGGGFAIRAVSATAKRVMELSGVAVTLKLAPELP